MKINNNISAIITNKQLLRTESGLAASMERLSSGLRINHASDDPSGLAISNKMRAQIDGLNQASRNSSDGMSVLETADGAMNEITSVIQRMRELCVQAANETNSQSDKEAIQVEIANIRSEIDRISDTTEFNTKSLLDGSLNNRVYTKGASRINVSETVAGGNYKLNVLSAAKQAELSAPLNLSSLGDPVTAANAGSISFNGSKAEIREGMSQEEVRETIREAAEIGEMEVEFDGSGNAVIRSTAYGDNAKIEISYDNIAMGTSLGLSGSPTIAYGTDAVVDIFSEDSLFKDSHPSATVRYEGNKITVTDTKDFEISMLLDKDTTGVISMDVTDIGPMALQVGANEGQQMVVKIPSMSVDNLYLDSLDVTTVTGADRGIAACDEALAMVSKVRASLGAYTNRLDYTVLSLDETSENMTSALSRISDVDMAEEMTEYTKNNVLEQAGTSALAQANELPQMALQLLG
ncbi:MAG: flagellin [Lachnospiraceae bacterium]|nr:flagellin [Lachnospiraceae bacterium]